MFAVLFYLCFYRFALFTMYFLSGISLFHFLFFFVDIKFFILNFTYFCCYRLFFLFGSQIQSFKLFKLFGITSFVFMHISLHLSYFNFSFLTVELQTYPENSSEETEQIFVSCLHSFPFISF